MSWWNRVLGCQNHRSVCGLGGVGAPLGAAPVALPQSLCHHKKPEGFCDPESPVPGIPQPGEQQPGRMMNRSLLNLSSPAALLRCANSYS